MSKHVSVILLEDVNGIGGAGEVVQVAEGYARNALFPAGKAALADAPEGKAVRSKKVKEEQQAKAELEKLQKQAEQLESTELVIPAKVKEGEGEELFGSVKESHIAEEFEKQTGASLKPRQIKLDKPIKQLGTYDVVVTLSPEVEFSLKVSVIPASES